MDDAARVRVLQPLRTPASAMRTASVDRQTLIVLRLVSIAARSPPAMYWRDDVRLRVLLAGVEHGDDVRVVAEPPHRLRLALHARQAVGVEAFGLDRRRTRRRGRASRRAPGRRACARPRRETTSRRSGRRRRMRGGGALPEAWAGTAWELRPPSATPDIAYRTWPWACWSCHRPRKGERDRPRTPRRSPHRSGSRGRRPGTASSSLLRRELRGASLRSLTIWLPVRYRNGSYGCRLTAANRFESVKIAHFRLRGGCCSPRMRVRGGGSCQRCPGRT